MLENVRHYLISLIIYRKQPPILNSRLDWTAIGEACGIEDEMTTELRKQLRPALDAIIRWLILESGDFVLVPQIHAFTMSSFQPPPPGMLPRRLETDPGVFRLGDPDASAEVTAMVGHCSFLANDKQLLSSPLPDIIHARGERRLMDLVGMIHAEMVGGLAARDMILSRLLKFSSSTLCVVQEGLRHLPDCCVVFPTSAWLQCCDASIRTRAEVCPSRNWQKPPQCRGRHSSTASEGRWASLRWNT